MAKPEVHRRPPHQPGTNREIIVAARRYGRTPKVTKPEDLPIGWEDMICDIMKEGAGVTEVRAEMDITYTLWTRWFSEWREFREVIERGLDLEAAWWLRSGRNNLGNKFFNANLYGLNMQMRFKWNRHRDQQIDDNRNARVTEEIEKEEDRRLDDLFNGGDGLAQQRQKSGPPTPAAEGEWRDVVSTNLDRRKEPPK